MRKIFLTTFLALLSVCSLHADIYTGTTLSKSISENSYLRLNQYIVSSETQWFFGRVGLFQESFKHTMEDYSGSEPASLVLVDASRDTAITSINIGIGFNLLSKNDYFIDLLFDYYHALDYTDPVGDKTYLNDGVSYQEITKQEG